MTDIDFRIAREEDLSEIVRLLAEDELGARREELTDPPSQKYIDAFAAMTVQADNNYIVAVLAGDIVGCYQLTIIHGLSRGGASRAQIESVRVEGKLRGQGVGKQMFQDAIERAQNSGCSLVQLTTDNSRTDAHRFYEDLGFAATHVGYKLQLT